MLFLCGIIKLLVVEGSPLLTIELNNTINNKPLLKRLPPWIEGFCYTIRSDFYARITI